MENNCGTFDKLGNEKIVKVRLTICVDNNYIEYSEYKLTLIGYIKKDPDYEYNNEIRFSEDKNFETRILVLENYDQCRFIVVKNDGSGPSIGSVCKLEKLPSDQDKKITENAMKENKNPNTGIYKKIKF